MINYVLGGIIFGLMIFTAISIIKNAKNQSCICGGSCSQCSSKCTYQNNEAVK